MFFPQGFPWGGGGGGLQGFTPGNKTILKNWGLIPYPCDTILCPK